MASGLSYFEDGGTTTNTETETTTPTEETGVGVVTGKGKKQTVANEGVLAAMAELYKDRKSTRLNSSHTDISRMPSSA